MSTKDKIVLGVSILVGLFLIGFSASGKLMGSEEAIAMFSKGGIDDWRTIIGIGEVVSAILFVLPATQRFGTWLLSAYFGGAIMYHMTIGESIMAPVAFLIIIWVLSVFRKDVPIKI